MKSTIDEVGQSTLENLKHADRLNHWMFDSIRPYLNGRILEIGSGIGNISACLVEQRIPLWVSDYSEHYCQLLRKGFSKERLVKGVYELDLADGLFIDKYHDLAGMFDTVFALNVLEHIQDDRRAIANANYLLAPGGHLIILVPAYQLLYNGFDKELEHFRRYTRESLKKLLLTQGFEMMKTWYFNVAGILGWFVSGSILKRKALPAGQLSLFNSLVPLFRVADRVTFNQVGLSVIIVGKKVSEME